MKALSIQKIGLTGGIGSGKSTVGQFLTQLGYPLVDADAISRSLTDPMGGAIDRIRQEFGASFITLEHSLDRNAMRELVFQDPNAKSTLENILHPMILKQIGIALIDAESKGIQTIVLDIPLLAESGRWFKILDRVLVIDCQVETQIQRVIQRSQLSRQTAQSIIAAQASRLQRLAVADWVIYNEGLTMSQLQAQVGALSRTF
ncbi:MAG: dephospho-CoA kinase [Limnohabitans sp.]|nr:dephospho-CoA kinase [Limnohabitans sp.]